MVISSLGFMKRQTEGGLGIINVPRLVGSGCLLLGANNERGLMYKSRPDLIPLSG